MSGSGRLGEASLLRASADYRRDSDRIGPRPLHVRGSRQPAALSLPARVVR